MSSSEDHFDASAIRHAHRHLKLLAALVLALVVATACDEDPAIAVTPVPTVEPTATPAAADALNGLSFEMLPRRGTAGHRDIEHAFGR